MIEIRFDHTQIDSMSNNAGVFIGKNLITNWNAHLKSNRNVVYNTPGLVGNFVSNSFNVIDDSDGLDFSVFSTGKNYND